VKLALPYEKALLANRLGMKPESFSRALARLREFGVVVEREHVVIGTSRGSPRTTSARGAQC
jgi:hypothetical protein